jgi:hypothetical protein
MSEEQTSAPQETVSEVSETPVESTSELQEVVEEAKESGATAEEIKDLIKEFELKVNGKTVTKKINLNDEDELRRELQLAAAGRSAMQEAAELKRALSQEIERLRKDPFSVLRELEVDVDELNEKYLQQKIEELKKSPEQLERENMQRELEEARRQLKAQEERVKRAEMEKLSEQAASQLDDEITNALKAHTELPNSEYTVKKIADIMLWAIDNGWDDVTVEDIIPTVKNEISKDISQILDGVPDEFLEAYLGKKTSQRLRDKRIKAAKKVENISNIQKTSQKSETTSSPKQKIKVEDWMRS